MGATSLLHRIPGWAGYLLWFAVVLAMVFASPNFAPLTGLRKTLLGGDFMQFYLAGTLLREGHLDRLYDLQFQQSFQLQQGWVPFQWSDGAVSLFVYPPQVAILFEPLSYLPYPSALLIWTGISVACFVAWFELTLRSFPELRPYRGGLLLLLLLYMPLVHAIYSAQNSTVSLLLVGASGLLFRRRADLGAGVCLSLLMFKPQLVPVFLLTALLLKRFRLLSGFMLGAIVQGLAVLVRSPGLFGSYAAAARTLGDWILMPGMPTANMSCLQGLWFNLLGPEKIELVRQLTLVSSCITLGLVAFAVIRDKSEPLRSWHIATLGAILVSPHLLHYDLTILLAPALWVIADGNRRGTIAALLTLFAAVVSAKVAAATGVQLAVIAMLGWLLAEVFYGASRNGSVTRPNEMLRV